MKSSIFLPALALCLACGLTACGQKGVLYLPQKPVSTANNDVAQADELTDNATVGEIMSDGVVTEQAY
ncbi:MAG: lipoprotein [Moraxella sp.]|nr:lipoprotein [Moraxella sp.]